MSNFFCRGSQNCEMCSTGKGEREQIYIPGQNWRENLLRAENGKSLPLPLARLTFPVIRQYRYSWLFIPPEFQAPLALFTMLLLLHYPTRFSNNTHLKFASSKVATLTEHFRVLISELVFLSSIQFVNRWMLRL